MLSFKAHGANLEVEWIFFLHEAPSRLRYPRENERAMSQSPATARQITLQLLTLSLWLMVQLNRFFSHHVFLRGDFFLSAALHCSIGVTFSSLVLKSIDNAAQFFS